VDPLDTGVDEPFRNLEWVAAVHLLAAEVSLLEAHDATTPKVDGGKQQHVRPALW
jgi:hypothetical protein